MKNKKMQNLFKENRTFKERLIIAALVSLAISITFLIFGTLDIVIHNMGTFPFYYSEIFWPVLAAGILLFLLLSGLLLLFKGKVFDVMVSFVFGVLVASYVQGNFLNSGLGSLTGDAVAWHRYMWQTILNLLFWIAVIAVPIIVRYFNKKVWTNMVKFVCFLLAVIQIVALGTTMLTTGKVMEKREDRYLSVDGIYEVSEKENIIVFVVDRLDNNYVDEIVSHDEKFFNKLDGFTYYNNYVSMACRTFPALAQLLTGKMSYYDKPYEQYFDEAWEQTALFKQLQEKNYTTKLYSKKPYTYSQVAQIDEHFDNVLSGRGTIDSKSVIGRLSKLSMYRYGPLALKPSFWMSSDSFSDYATVDAETQNYRTDDVDFYNNLKDTQLSTQNNKNNFALYHLYGSHEPLDMDENGQRVEHGETSVEKQTKGCFNIIYEYINQMKKLGVYENSTIIIMGDHGYSADWKKLDRAITTGLFIKPKGSSKDLLKESTVPVSQDNVRATIAKAAGIASQEYAESVYELTASSNPVRKYYYYVTPVVGDDFLEEYEIKGNARDFKNWKKVKDRDAPYPHK